MLRRDARSSCHGVRAHCIATQRRCADVEVLFSDVFEPIRELVTNGVPDGATNANACRFSQCCQPHGYVAVLAVDPSTRSDQGCESVPGQCSDGTAYQIVAITGHLINSDPNAESNPPVG